MRRGMASRKMFEMEKARVLRESRDATAIAVEERARRAKRAARESEIEQCRRLHALMRGNQDSDTFHDGADIEDPYGPEALRRENEERAEIGRQANAAAGAEQARRMEESAASEASDRQVRAQQQALAAKMVSAEQGRRAALAQVRCWRAARRVLDGRLVFHSGAPHH